MRTRDLTTGPILPGVAAFALPLLGTSIIQQLYSTVDLLFVGNVLGTASTAALGVGSLLITILAGLFTGVSVGVNVRAASLFGSGDDARLASVLRASLGVAVAFGFGLVLAGELLADAFVEWMAVPGESADAALAYMRYAVAAALPIAVYNASAGALRGLGDSRSPLLAQVIGGLLNIVANWLALCVLGWGIAGAAFAIYLKVELPIYYVILAVGQATTTFVAQNHGARLDERCMRGIRVCQALCCGLAVLMAIVMLAIGYWAFWLFDRSDGVIALGGLMMQTTFPFYFLYSVLEVQADAMRGYGHSLAPALVVLANICVLRVALIWVLVGHGLGLQAIAATYPITWATTAICMVALRLVFIRSRRMA